MAVASWNSVDLAIRSFKERTQLPPMMREVLSAVFPQLRKSNAGMAVLDLKIATLNSMQLVCPKYIFL